MEQELKKDKVLWRKVQVSKCIRVILIFLGILFMQLIAYMLCVLGYTVIHMSEGMPVLQITQLLDDFMTDSDSSLLIWVSAVSAVLCMVWCGILYRKSDWRQEKFSYIQAFSAKRILGIVGIGFGGCIVLSTVLSVMVSLFPGAFASYQELMSHLDTENNLITVFYVLLIGPVSEELIFRGAIMDRLKIAFPFWLANVLQAVLFGLYHMNLVQGLYAFCLGTALGLVGAVTGSILASIFTHIVFNATSNLLGICFDGTGKYEGVCFLAVVILAVFGLAAGLEYYLKEWKKQTREGGIQKKNVLN